MKDIPNINIPNLHDLATNRFVLMSVRLLNKIYNYDSLLISNTTETSTSSVVIKSVITSISHEKTNGESEILKTNITTHEESQF